MTERVTLTIDNDIATVTLNRADKHNAIDMAMFHAIDNVINKLKKNNKIRAVIVHGDGENFCTGLDVKSVLKSQSNGAKLLFKWLPGQSNLAQRVSTGWREIPCPVIMVLHGKVWGGGLQIAQGGDFRIAQPDTELSILEAKWGLIPDMGGALSIKEQMQTDKAKYLAMTGKSVLAQEALDIGLITEVNEDPMARALQMVEEIKVLSPDSVAGVKKLYNHISWRSQAYALAKESWYQIRILMGKNQRIKTYNQINSDKTPRSFKQRLKW